MAGISIPFQARPGGDAIMKTHHFDPHFDYIKMLLALLQDGRVCSKKNCNSFPVTIFQSCLCQPKALTGFHISKALELHAKCQEQFGYF